MKSSKSFQGSVCLYQGEELGQSETEMEYHELTDPQGIQFWPADKGRDGCRTPMSGIRTLPMAGFQQRITLGCQLKSHNYYGLLHQKMQKISSMLTDPC